MKIFCSAKINLSLHITGKRDDGYHLLESLVVFAKDMGDEITLSKAATTNLSITGPFADVVPLKNSLLDAVQFAEQRHGKQLPISISLQKNLPAGAGLGGGSADAAGVLRGLEQLYDLPSFNPAKLAVLGADVPVCYVNQSSIMRGIGEQVIPVTLPAINLLLANPGIAISTPAVFQALNLEHIPRRRPGSLEEYMSSIANTPAGDPGLRRGTSMYWQHHTNDLEPIARQLYPALDDAMTEVATMPGVNLTRLSGSGSTFFVMGDDLATLEKLIASRWPEWWLKRTTAAT